MMIEIVHVKIEDLKPAEYNPRRLTEKQGKDLEESITRFDMVEPIVVNKHPGREQVIVGGHQRFNICKKMGRETMPVVYVDLDEEKEKELNLRLNRNLGEWDFDMLANMFDEAMLKDVGFDELENIFPPNEVEEDEAPEASTEPPKSKLGEVYQLGRHRLMCGDATKIEDVEKLMDGKKTQLLLTDPPYSVNYSGKNEFLNKIDKGNRNQTDIKGDIDIDTAKVIWLQAFGNAEKVMDEVSSYYSFAPQGGDHMMMMMMMIESSLLVKHELIWVKNNHVLGRADYAYKHEPIIYGWKKTGTHKFYGGFQTSIFEFDKPLSSKLHPTMKPISLLSKLIDNSSKQDDIVLDLFGGSGSTLIACEQTDRTCYMMELDEKYVDVIRRRYWKFVNNGDETGCEEHTPVTP